MSTNEEIKIAELQKWFQEKKGSLPKCIDMLLLKRFYFCMFEDIEETKKLILTHYKLRQRNPEIFMNRDPADSDTRRTFDYVDMVPLPGLTPENYKVSCFRLCDFDPNKIHHTEDTKAFFMLMDCRFISNDIEFDPTVLAAGEVQIFDMTGFTMKHLSKLSFSTLRTYVRFMQEALPVRLKAVHVINCPPYLDKIITVIKPFISAEVFKLIIFHTRGLEQLYEYVPQHMLPADYGGEGGKLSEMKSSTIQCLLEKRSYVMDPDYWQIELS